MDIEKNNDILVEKSSPEREEDAQQTEYVRITEKLTDIKVINRFNFQLRNSKTNEEKLSDLKVLAETPSPILYKFYSTPGLRTLGEWIYEGSANIEQNSVVLEKIFVLLKEMQLRVEHLDNAHYLGLGIEKMIIAQQNSEDNQAFNIFYKFYNMNKQLINSWLDSFKHKCEDPNFKRQQLWSENKLTGKRPFNNQNNMNNNMNNKYQQQNKFNQNNNFNKQNNKYGAGNNYQRGDSPPTQKKMKYNNNNSGSTGFNNNSNNNNNFKPGVKSVRFTGDDLIKRFRKEDEPVAADMTDAEVETYQEECIKKKQANIHTFTTQDMRKMENKLEKESRDLQKKSEIKERQMLDDMKIDIEWKTPIKIKGLNAQYFEILSSESLEKKLHEKRILCKMQSLYGSDADIPKMPCYDNIINDKLSATEPKKIYLNKLDENDFIQIIEMAIKNENQEQNKKSDKKVLRSILKVSKEEKELQRKKTIQEKKKQAEDEERIKSQINQHTFNSLMDLIMNNKNSNRDELISSVKNLGLTEKELQNIYQNINVIKKLWHQRQSLPQGKFGSGQVEERKEQDKGIVPPPHLPQSHLPAPVSGSQQSYNNINNNNSFGGRQGNNPNQTPFQHNQGQGNLNGSNQYGQQNFQNNSYNQYRSQQVNPQSNFSQNSFNNNNNNNNQYNNYQNNQPKPSQGMNNQFNNQPNNFNNNNNNQRFGSNNNNNAPNNNNYPNQQQQNYEYNPQNQNSQGFEQPQQQQPQGQQQQPPFQSFQNNQNNQYNNNQSQSNYYQQNNNNFNNRGGPQSNQPPRSSNTPAINTQQNNNLPNNQYNQQQNRQGNFGSNQGQQNQQPYQQKAFNNNNPNMPPNMQNKPYTPNNQQNKPAGFNPNNANMQQGGQQGQLPGQQTNEESTTKHIPCRMFHSEMGCKRDICNFLHVPEFQGRAPPNMHKLVRPMHALSKNGERNLENIFAYNKAKFEKKIGQLNTLPFPVNGGPAGVPPPPPSNLPQNNQFVPNQYQQQQQQMKPPQPQQGGAQNGGAFLFQSTNPLLKQQFKPQPPQKI